jgi:hypothetical protein
MLSAGTPDHDGSYYVVMALFKQPKAAKARSTMHSFCCLKLRNIT